MDIADRLQAIIDQAVGAYTYEDSHGLMVAELNLLIRELKSEEAVTMYHVFIGAHYYPGQTMDCYFNSFTNLDEAKEKATLEIYADRGDWVHIIAVINGVPTLVASGEQNFGKFEWIDQ